jgi:hypothetical protein
VNSENALMLNRKPFGVRSAQYWLFRSLGGV